MSNADLPTIETAQFSAASTLEQTTIQVRLTGNADMRAVPILEGFVPKIHAEARRLKCEEVVVDMTALEFMNSSCFRTFVNWLSWIRGLEESERYVVRFQAAPDRHWQRPSLSALSCFAVDIVRVDNIDL